MKPHHECTPEEINNYNIAQQDTVDTHTRGIVKLRQRNFDPATPEDEWKENNEKITDLRADRSIVRARRDAFYAKRATIKPPTEAQMDELKKNLDMVNSLEAKRKIVNDVVKFAHAATETFTKIQPLP